MTGELDLMLFLFCPRDQLVPRPCYKFEMPKSVVQWLLFKYINGDITFLSKPFKTKQLAEKARLKYPEQERKKIGVGVVLAES